MNIGRYGVAFPCGLQVIAAFGDRKDGETFLIKTRREEITVRVTPTGRLRVSGVGVTHPGITFNGVDSERQRAPRKARNR